MSYNKNSVNQSTILHTTEILKKSGTPYKLFERGEVLGIGLNDFEGHDNYILYRLEFLDVVCIDLMCRHHDPDFDDIILTTEYDKDSSNIPDYLEYYDSDPDYDELGHNEGKENLIEIKNEVKIEVLPEEKLSGNLVS